MKTILSLLVSVSLFCIPLVSTARALTRPPAEKLIVIPGIPTKESAFKVPEINMESSICGSVCLSEAVKHLEREAVKALNRTPTREKSAETVGSLLKVIPAVSSRLQMKDSSLKEAKLANRALVAAITQSVRDNWEPETQANVIKFAQALVQGADPVANQKKLEEVKENCRL